MSKKQVMYKKAKGIIEKSGCKLLSNAYINSNEDLNILCGCGNEFTSTYKYFQTTRLKMCPECKLVEKSKELNKKHVEFKREVFNLVGDEYLVVGQYVKYHEHIKMKHNECGYEWDVRPSNFIHGGTRCPKCAGYMKNNTKEFKTRIYEIYGDEYKVMGEYVRNDVKIEVLHTECGKTNMIRPNDILKGNRCHHCSGLKRKTLKQIQEEVCEIVGDEYIVDGVYKNNKSPLTFTHNRCKATFKMNANNFISSEQRCPICAMSKGEQVIYKCLTEHNVKFAPQKFYVDLRGVNDGSLSYDFYLPKHNLLIEYQGRQHESYREGFHISLQFFENQVEHDRRKREYAKQNNIKLLEIWYYDFDNIEAILAKELNLTKYNNKYNKQHKMQFKEVSTA